MGDAPDSKDHCMGLFEKLGKRPAEWVPEVGDGAKAKKRGGGSEPAAASSGGRAEGAGSKPPGGSSGKDKDTGRGSGGKGGKGRGRMDSAGIQKLHSRLLVQHGMELSQLRKEQQLVVDIQPSNQQELIKDLQFTFTQWNRTKGGDETKGLELHTAYWLSFLRFLHAMFVPPEGDPVPSIQSSMKFLLGNMRNNVKVFESSAKIER